MRKRFGCSRVIWRSGVLIFFSGSNETKINMPIGRVGVELHSIAVSHSTGGIRYIHAEKGLTDHAEKVLHRSVLLNNHAGPS
jgi:hypothetical protein